MSLPSGKECIVRMFEAWETAGCAARRMHSRVRVSLVGFILCEIINISVFLQEMTSLEILQKYWGYDSFRPMQEEIISAALDGRDVLAILPTGGGKSVCFQVPALMRDGLALVVTPLIALMKDQVQNLES